MTTSVIPTAIQSKHSSSTPSFAAQAGRFVLHFLEMQIPMGLGMFVYAVLIRQLRASPSYAVVFQRGSALSILLDGLLMTVPMVVWMILRGHDRRHSLEMGASMIVPGIAIILLGWVGVGAYLPWLAKAACPIMCSGMIIYMLYRRDHFTGRVDHSTHAMHQAVDDVSCHTV
jgi:hypothetical protein